jgi:hypothetical protein
MKECLYIIRGKKCYLIVVNRIILEPVSIIFY